MFSGSASGHAADHLRLTLTVADGSDDTEDEKPEEHISGVAQQQDKEQADHHGYHQAAAKTQKHWELSQVLSAYYYFWPGETSPLTDEHRNP